MLARTLISEIHSPLLVSCSEKEALATMHAYKIFNLPVIDNDNNFLGIIFEEDITEHKGEKALTYLDSAKLSDIKIFAHQHIFDIYETMFVNNLQSIPVVEENNKYLGLITCNTLIMQFSKISALHLPGAILVLEVNSRDYTLSQIARIIEEQNAKILSCYVQSIEDSTDIEITIKLNTHEIGEIVQSLQRFDYTIKTYFEGYNKLHELYKDRIEQLKNYLEI